MTDEQRQALQQAFGAHLKSGAEFLAAWIAGLSAEDSAKLDELVARGLRLGISVNNPNDRFAIQVFLLDSAGETRVVGTIDQPGTLPSVTIN